MPWLAVSSIGSAPVEGLTPGRSTLGDVSADGTFRLIRGSKLKLAEVDPALIGEAMRPGSRLVARVRIRPPDLAWSAIPALSAAHAQAACRAVPQGLSRGAAR